MIAQDKASNTSLMTHSSLSIAQVSEHASPLADDIGSPDAGGQNIYVRELGLAQAALGHRVTIYTRRTSVHQPGRASLGPNVDVVHVAAGPARELPKEDLAPLMGDFGDQLALHWREQPPDIVHAHYWMSGIAALAGVRRTSIPVVATFHALALERIRYHPCSSQELQRERERERERAGSERVVAQVADAIIALTAEEVGYLTGPNGASPSKITVVPVGVDLATFTPHGPALPRPARPRLVTIGRLVPRKGVQTVIEAVAALPRSLDAELKIAGGPAHADLRTDPSVRSLRDHARKHAVLDRVEFLGRIPHARVPELLRSADIFVCAPHYEPFGTAALEAAACGRPVVATAVGGLREHIINGETGHLIPAPHDGANLASALAKLIINPRQRTQFGIAGAQRATRYAWPRVAEEILTVYRSVLFRGLHVSAFSQPGG